MIAGVAGVVLIVVLLATSDSAVEVETARVQRDSLRVAVIEEGRTRLRDRFVVAAPIAGRVARIVLEEGDRVTVGAVIARIAAAPEDPRTIGVASAQASAAEARRREATAQVREAEGQVAQAEREAARSRALADAGAISAAAAERTELAAATARRQLDAARAALRAAEAELAAARAALAGSAPGAPTGQEVVVRAPSAGRVLRVLETSARVVPAGTPLVEIGDARGLEVVVDVLSQDAVQISPGERVIIDEWGGDRPLEGRVRIVEPNAFTEVSALGVEEQRVNVIVDLVQIPPALGAGYGVEAQIITWAGERVLIVPTSALFQRDGVWQVFVVERGKAVLRPVEIGHRSAEAAEVVRGLRESEEVIVFPSDEIAPGSPVRPR
jgi:HlyD family secretion protein